MLITIVVLCLIVILLVAGVIYAHYRAIVKWAEPRFSSIVPADTDCTGDLAILPRLDTKQKICCYQDGRPTGAFYVSRSSGINFSVGAVPVYYLTVCEGFCSSGSRRNADGTLTCLNGDSIGQTRANACIKDLIPTNCTGSAKPVAVLGATPYFALEAETPSGVPNCSPESCDLVLR